MTFFTGDFEEGDFSDFDVNANMLIATDHMWGSYSGDTNEALNSYVRENFTKRAAGKWIYASAWVMRATLTADTSYCAVIKLGAQTGDVDVVQAEFEANGANPATWALKYRNYGIGSYVVVDTTVEVTIGRWYFVVIGVYIDDSDGKVGLWVNGTRLVWVTGFDNWSAIAGNSRPDRAYWGAFKANGGTQYNDIRVDNCELSETLPTMEFGVGTWTLNARTSCQRVLDIDIEEMVDFASKGILGKDTPTVNPDNYTTTPKRWTIVMRMTLAKRTALKTEKDKHETLMFVLQAGESDYVKFEEMYWEWAGDECYDCPWLVTVVLISVLY